MDPNNEAISKKTVHGIFALTSRTFVLNIISLIAFVVISSVLLPSQIGIYTAVIAIQRIISFFTDFGIGAALVQKKDEVLDEDLVTSFTLQSGITLIIFLLVFFLRSQLSSIFHLNHDATNLLMVLVFTIFISSFKTIPSILLERKIDFHRLVIPQIAESLIFNLLLVALVLKGFGLNAFSIAFLVSSIVGIPFYYYVSPWRPRLGFYRKSLGHLRYGLQFQSKNVIATIKDDFLTVILTKLISYQELGYVGFAQRLSFFVYRYVVDSVTKVTFSTYSRVQEDKEFLKKAVEKSLFFVSSIMFPALTGLIIISPYFIRYFPGWHNKWEPAVFSVVFFSLNAMISSVSGIIINLLDATGRVSTTLKFMLMWTILTWILTPIFIFYLGYNGVSLASFLVSSSVVITIYIARKIVDFSLVKSLGKPTIFSIILGIIVYGASRYLVHDFISLIAIIILGGVVYLSLLYSTSKNEFKTIIRVFLKT